MIKRTVAAFGCAIALLTLSASLVAGGEVTGNGKSLKPLQANSECAFSGRNDTYSGDPNVPDAEGFYRTQSWGQIPQADRDFLRSIGVSPDTLCNGHLHPMKH